MCILKNKGKVCKITGKQTFWLFFKIENDYINKNAFPEECIRYVCYKLFCQVEGMFP